VGSPILTPAAELADPCSTTVDDWKKTLRVHVQGWDQGAAAPSCITTLKSNTDVVAVRRVRGCTAGTSGCAAATSSGAYLQVAQCATESGTAATMYNLGVGTPGTPLHLKDCTTVAPLREYLARTYFISTDNGAGQNIPTLKRKELTGSSGSLSITETPLVEGIEFLHLVYGIDDTGDGMPDGYGADPNTYTRAGCTTCSALNNWMNVVTVQVYLLARNIDTSPGYTDTKTYNLGIDASGNAVSVGPFNDAYRRHVYSSVIRIANPAGRRDTP
ncbi:MAG TPA: PilW family protein, partial [Burkholderiales bacterium]|nr:PilW family protein [Burkholderiales bacterium]